MNNKCCVASLPIRGNSTKPKVMLKSCLGCHSNNKIVNKTNGHTKTRNTDMMIDSKIKPDLKVHWAEIKYSCV